MRAATNGSTGRHAVGCGDRSWVMVADHVDGRSRSAVAAVRALAAAGYLPVVAVSGGPSSAAASRACADVVALPRPGTQAYPGAVARELASRPYAAVLPASDAALTALGHPGARLVDKSALPALAAAAGLEVPETLTFDGAGALAAAASDLPFPVVVKPVVKMRAAAVAERVDSAEGVVDLLTRLDDGPVVVQPFLSGRVRAVCGVIHDGKLLAVSHQAYARIWPPQCGTASAAVTTGPDRDLESRIPALLSGHQGVFQVQLVDDLVIDVNPRVYGSLPLAVAAGANLAAIAVAAGSGGRVEESVVRARSGVRYRWLEGDLRRIARDVRHRDLSPGSAVWALLPRRGTAHSVESVTDPGPALSRLGDVLRRTLT